MINERRLFKNMRERKYDSDNQNKNWKGEPAGIWMFKFLILIWQYQFSRKAYLYIEMHSTQFCESGEILSTHIEELKSSYIYICKNAPWIKQRQHINCCRSNFNSLTGRVLYLGMIECTYWNMSRIISTRCTFIFFLFICILFEFRFWYHIS